MSQKPTKINNTQPQKTVFTSSQSNQVPNYQNTQDTVNKTIIPILGDYLKQGTATGIGFGLANAAISSVINNLGENSKNTEQISFNPESTYDKNTNPSNCEFFLNQYTHCLKSHANIMEDNCEWFLTQFKSCQIKNK